MTLFTSPPKSNVPPLQQWHPSTWDDYCALRDDSTLKHIKLSFNHGWLWIDMGGESLNHARCSNLFPMIWVGWSLQYPEQSFRSFGRCLLERPKTKACAPDLVLYAGDDAPQWQKGDRRLIDLSTWRVPDLVGEISDTTLASDLDEQKHLYASLGIPEYWVIDVKGERVFAFQLNEQGEYQQCEQSGVLAGLSIDLLTEAVQKLSTEANTAVAAWFARAIAQ